MLSGICGQGKKNLIFDIGDVLIGYRQSRDLLLEYGFTGSETDHALEVFSSDPDGMWKRYELGECALEDVITSFERRDISSGTVIRWFLENTALCPVPRPEIWDRLCRLRQSGYRLFILSNYGEELFASHMAGVPFLEKMEDVTVSYMVHLLKPDRRIYEYLLEKNHLKAEECVFFDDKEVNTAAAAELGIEAVLVSNRRMLADTLDGLLEK